MCDFFFYIFLYPLHNMMKLLNTEIFICRKECNVLTWGMTVRARRHYIIPSTKKPTRIHTSLESYIKKNNLVLLVLSSLFLIVLMRSLFLIALKLSSNCVNTKDWNILIEIEISFFLLAHSYINMVKKWNDSSMF